MADRDVRLSDWTFQPSLGQLCRGKLRKKLPAQQVFVLDELVGHYGQLVTRDRLIHLLWPTKVVDYDRSLNAIVKQLRHALGDDSVRPRYIETIPTKGYRFVGRVEGQPREEKKLGRDVSPESDNVIRHAAAESALVKRLADTVVELVGAQFGAIFFRLEDDKGVPRACYEVSGADPAIFRKFSLPRNTDIFTRTFHGEMIVSGHIGEDGRFGRNPPINGTPKGHPAVVSYMGVPLTAHDGLVIGGLFLGHPKADRFDVEVQRRALLFAAMAAEALDLSSKLRHVLQRSEENGSEAHSKAR